MDVLDLVTWLCETETIEHIAQVDSCPVCVGNCTRVPFTTSNTLDGSHFVSSVSCTLNRGRHSSLRKAILQIFQTEFVHLSVGSLNDQAKLISIHKGHR